MKRLDFVRKHYKPIAIGAVSLGVVILVVALLLCRPDRTPTDGSVVTTTTAAAKTTVTTTVTTTTTTQTTTTTATTTTTLPTTTTTTAAPTTTTAATKPSFTPQDDGVWNLKLVNKWNTMTQAESDQLPISWFSGSEYCDSRIVEPLRAMLAAGSEYGLYVTSGYRSYSLQERLYNNKVQRVMNAQGCTYEEALDIAATEVARPGTSEHNTGLAVDLLHNECWELERYWEDSEAFDWLMEHCAEYGFILRFPEGKQDITGVIYEPWHYRYVGVEAATEIMSRGITLEEYVLS